MDRDEWERKNAQAQEAYAAVHHRAEEEHIAYIVREAAVVEERTAANIGGEPEITLVRSVTIEGEHPTTKIRVRVFDRSQNRERTPAFPVWSDSWTGPDGKRWPPHKIAGDMLMLARGG